MMTARIQVKETKRYWGDFEGSLEGIISSLQSELDEGWEGIEMGSDQWSYDHEFPYLYKHRPGPHYTSSIWCEGPRGPTGGIGPDGVIVDYSQTPKTND